MNFVAVAIVSAIVLGHPLNKSRLLIGLNRILLCLNDSSQITKNPGGGGGGTLNVEVIGMLVENFFGKP